MTEGTVRRGVQMTSPPLWQHQTEAIEQALASFKRCGGFALWHEMATGKTRTAIEVARAVAARKVLVICPTNVVGTWVEQVRAYAHEYSTRVLTGLSPQQRDAKLLIQMAGQEFVLINYESSWRTPKLLKQDWDLVIYDEAHRLKQPSGQQSMFAGKLAGVVPYRLALSGTPTPHGPLDAWAVYRALTPTNPLGFRTFTQFRTRFLRPAAMDEWHDRDLVYQRTRGGDLLRFKIRDIDMLHDRMYELADRVLADDVVERPEPFDHVIHVDLEPAARKAYKELDQNLTTILGGGNVNASNAMVAVLRLAQLTGGTLRNDVGEEIRISTAKEKALADFLEDVGEEPVVVFGRFHSDLDAIARACDEAGVTYTELSGRLRGLDGWQAGKQQVLITQIQSGGIGIDLTRSRIAVFYSVGYNLGEWLQARARIHRPNSKHHMVSYYSMVARKTVDEEIYAALDSRQEVVDALIEQRRAA